MMMIYPHIVLQVVVAAGVSPEGKQSFAMPVVGGTLRCGTFSWSRAVAGRLWMLPSPSAMSTVRTFFFGYCLNKFQNICTRGFTTLMKMGRMSAWSSRVLSAVSAAQRMSLLLRAAWLPGFHLRLQLPPPTALDCSAMPQLAVSLQELSLVSKWISQGCQVSGYGRVEAARSKLL